MQKTIWPTSLLFSSMFHKVFFFLLRYFKQWIGIPRLGADLDKVSESSRGGCDDQNPDGPWWDENYTCENLMYCKIINLSLNYLSVQILIWTTSAIPKVITINVLHDASVLCVCLEWTDWRSHCCKLMWKCNFSTTP